MRKRSFVMIKEKLEKFVKSKLPRNSRSVKTGQLIMIRNPVLTKGVVIRTTLLICNLP